MSTKKECVSCKKTTKVIKNVVLEPKVETAETVAEVKASSNFTEEQVALINKFTSTNKLTAIDVKNLFALYNSFYNKKVDVCLCSGTIRYMIEKLNKDL